MATAGAHRSANLVILVGVVPVLLATALAAAPQPRSRTVYVTVIGPSGGSVAGLTADDFTVKEDGRPREIVRAEPASEPMQVALLLDDAGPSLGATRQAAGGFVERLQGKAAFSLTTTGGRALTRVNFTDDPRLIYGALQNLFANPVPTSQFLDAVVQASQDFVRRRAVRPVIVAIAAEGEDTSSVGANLVLRDLQQSRAVFYHIGLGLPVTAGTRPPLDANRPSASTEFESVQRNIVIGSAPRDSGGRSEQVLQPAGIAPLTSQFAIELTGQYALTYRTDTDRARLQVATIRPGIKVRAPARVGDK